MGSGSIRVTLTPEQDQRIQKVARDLYEKKYKSMEKPQESFAADLGVTQPHISDLVNGHTSLSLKRAEVLAKLAGFADLVAMIGPVAPAKEPFDGAVPQQSKFPNLNVCLVYHGADSWPPYAIALANHGFFGNEDVPPAEWAKRMDEISAYLTKFPRKK